MQESMARGVRRVLGTAACVAVWAAAARAQSGGSGGGGAGGSGGSGGTGSGSTGGAGSTGAGSAGAAGTGGATAGATGGAPGGAGPATGGIGLPAARAVPAADTAAVAFAPAPLSIAATLTRADAVARALALSPTTARAGAVVRLARSAERVARSEYLPSLSINSSVLRNGSPSLAGASLAGVIGPTGLGGTGGGTGGSDSSGTAGGGLGGTYGNGTSASAAPTATGVARGYTPSRAPVAAPSDPVAQTGGTPAAPSAAAASLGTTAYMTVVAGYDVFTAGRRSADNRRARAETRAAEAISVSQRFRVVEQVETVFYDVRRAEDLEAVALAQVRRASEDARQAGRRRQVGTATPADVLQFQLLLNNARVLLAQASIQRRASAYALGRLTGVPGAVEARLDTAIVPRPLALSDSAILALALAGAPTLVAARDSVRAADAGVGAARAQYLPNIRLGGSYTMAQAGIPVAGARQGWAVALTTSYPVFNGAVREYGVARAEAAQQLAQVTAADAEREARSEVERRLGDIALAAQQVRLSQSAVQVARESYRVQNARYGAGVATVLDLSNAEQQLTQAEQQLVNATYDYALARASLNTFLGREL